jgi:hypothetical protein
LAAEAGSRQQRILPISNVCGQHIARELASDNTVCTVSASGVKCANLPVRLLQKEPSRSAMIPVRTWSPSLPDQERQFKGEKCVRHNMLVLSSVTSRPAPRLKRCPFYRFLPRVPWWERPTQ